jgi:hypothetical protein
MFDDMIVATRIGMSVHVQRPIDEREDAATIEWLIAVQSPRTSRRPRQLQDNSVDEDKLELYTKQACVVLIS